MHGEIIALFGLVAWTGAFACFLSAYLIVWYLILD